MSDDDAVTPVFFIPAPPELPDMQPSDLIRIEWGDGEVRHVIVTDVVADEEDPGRFTVSLLPDPSEEQAPDA